MMGNNEHIKILQNITANMCDVIKANIMCSNIK